jgi:glycosyltransferase involved in cell wall biosynthesis/SAM-dependent methyltransferase
MEHVGGDRSVTVLPSIDKHLTDGPLVSVLTPSFGQVRWLADNIASVERQTYRPIEHVVMDGGSQDGSVALLQARARPSLRWWSEPDGGQSEAINKAFRESGGEIIGWLNSDDAYFDPDVVDAAVRIFAARPEVMVVYGHAALVDADGQIVQLIWAPPFSSRLLRLHDFISQPAAFVRRSAVGDRLVDESFHYAMDYELWLRLAVESRFARLDRIVAIDRHHPSRKSYTWHEAAARDGAVLRGRYGVARRSGPIEVAHRSVKVALRVAGATLVMRIERHSNPLGWRLDSRRRLLRRQIMVRRAAMSLGGSIEHGAPRPESPTTREQCPACGAGSFGFASARTKDLRLARCKRCGHRRKVTTEGESPLAIAIDVGDREPSTPAGWLLARLPPAMLGADRLNVLDVGCWDGGLLAGLPNRWHRRGLEPNPPAAARAREAGLDVATSSFEDWPVEAGGYDLVVMLDVLEHIDDPRTTVQKVYELLRPGGVFAALTGDGSCLAARVFGEHWYYCLYPEHISFFTRRGLDTLLRDQGFETTMERVAHPMSGHLADVLKVAARLRQAFPREARLPAASSLGLGANLQTASRLLRGRDHVWVVARKAEAGDRS